MGRRYLTSDEADGALRRGKVVECFLGACASDDGVGIARISISLVGEVTELSLFKSADIGSAEFLDVYAFPPLNASPEQDEPDEVCAFASLEECLVSMEARWPGSSERLVNEFVVQDEYRDYMVNQRR
jgi:hypothetical protein